MAHDNFVALARRRKKTREEAVPDVTPTTIITQIGDQWLDD